MRDIVRRIAIKEINRLWPRPRYGVVFSINRPALTCEVDYEDETGHVTVRMGSVQPSATGQTVRIDGPSGDRYVAAIMGAAYYA